MVRPGPASTLVLRCALTVISAAAIGGAPAVGADSTPGHPRGTYGPAACGVLQPLGLDGACTHGPDPAPDGVDPTVAWPGGARSSERGEATATALAPPRVPCYGDGTEGRRTQAIYAFPADRPDRYTSVAPSISTWAAEMDQVFAVSARQTGGVRHVRFVTDANCSLVVDKVRLSAAGDDSIGNTVAELQALGYRSRDRKYLVWMDSTVLCGIAGYYLDDRPTDDNVNNSGVGQVARVDSGCWGQASRGQSVEAHELMHVLGSVQPSAPNSTSMGHCSDDADRMCYADGSPGVVIRSVCATGNEPYFDCGKQDYFNTAPPAGSYLATHWNTAASEFLATAEPGATSAPPSPAPSPSPSSEPSPEPDPLLPLPRLPILDQVTSTADAQIQTLPPARLADTRDGTGGRKGPLGPDETFDLDVVGRGGVPADGVAGVLLNVTATGGTAASALTAYPAGAKRPPSPNVVFARGQTRPNLVVVGLGDGTQVTIHNTAGAAHVVVDVVGWYDDGGGAATSRFSSLPPTRVLDTRQGLGAPRAAVGAAGTVRLQATGRGGVPTAGVAAVLLNVTVTEPSASGFLTVFPGGTKRPLASSLNFVKGQTVPNLVLAAVGAGGTVDLYSQSGQAHVVADVVGWLDNGSGAGESAYGAVTPTTVLDTRDGTGGTRGALGAGRTVDVQVTGVAGVPADGVAGVVLSLLAISPTASSFLTVHPAGATRPVASNLNVRLRESAANVVVVPVGSDGRVSVYNLSGFTHVRVDVVGFLSSS